MTWAFREAPVIRPARRIARDGLPVFDVIEKEDQSMKCFSDLGLAEPVLRAVEAEGYSEPTPIQTRAIPALMDGHDLIGVAQTGTGKTAAFSLPLLSWLHETDQKPVPKQPRAVILAPTRELAAQIGQNVRLYGKGARVRSAAVFGGVSIRRQIETMRRGVHVLIATPGRLIDLWNLGHVDLSEVDVFILDEADRMLDMGFIHDVRKIAAATPEDRQTVMFSATMPKAVEGLAESLLDDPVRVEAAPQATTAKRVEQRVLFVKKEDKRRLLLELLSDDGFARVLVFTRTKHGADRVARWLEEGRVNAAAIHGNKSQNARQRSLKGFSAGKVRVLVATDIAARGIDVDDVTHVINFELPDDIENYVHRVGRTARGGAAGVALSFCSADERGLVGDVERATRQSIPVMADHAFHDEAIASDIHSAARPKRGGGNANRGGAKSGARRPGSKDRPNRGGEGGKPGGQNRFLKPKGASGGQGKNGPRYRKGGKGGKPGFKKAA